MKTLIFNTENSEYPLTFLGRNGTFKCKGITLIPESTRINLYPVTSKGDEGRCRIAIPLEALPKVIESLTAMLPKKTYYILSGTGRTWEVYFHNGIDKHGDGSPFYGLRICKTKYMLATFLTELKSAGYLMQ